MQRYLLFLLICIIPLMLLSAETTFKEQPMKVIILFGPPASGKGTQAVRLAEKLHVPHISTGDLFRENMSKNTPLGKKAKEFIDAGKLVPDSLVLDMLFDRLSQNDIRQGYVLDGFPRTLAQAESFERRFPSNTSVTVFNLIVSDDTIVKRALGRKRSDDTPEVIKERLRSYYEQTAPLIDHYKKKGVLVDIDGEKTPDEVFLELIQSPAKYDTR